ncbi:MULTISPECIES: ATP-binding protein [unclassified Aliivibrio]|uniref:ATP-binding protein n=1 Tax=unclassified Aliivibrio TaxID=2645654 RepID=UPI00080E23E4|nr:MULTISPECIES: ATP-binding protein [unclassified Aliivibrio]OCH17421.1 anti-sigma F factor antagonist [Aliivibrio sp. 1S165]OCH23522.1 anti-sigma F factor antagonist [Aliivibrio sp. 1S128]OCH34414.1 anti-sigma F factor antagonist [Aliivibrio sp. 1S175]
MESIFSSTYPSSIEASRFVSNDIKIYWASLNISEDTINQAELCLVEMVNNAYEHAYLNQDGPVIEVKSYLQTPALLITEISDYGQALPQEVLVQSTEQSFIVPEEDKPETWLTSGRGFIIVDQLMDTIAYENKDGKNTFYLGKRLR